MRPVLTIALKDLRLLARDPRSAVILLAMPLMLILVLGFTLETAFGQKPDNTVRISLVVEDIGLPADAGPFPGRPWSEVVIDDLSNTAGLKVELVPSRAEAERVVKRGDRAAVVVLKPEFSDRAHRCSFVGKEFKRDPLNPLDQFGMRTDLLGVEFIESQSQPVGASVTRQVIQVTLFRVVIPWMIGQAFAQIGTDKFMDKMEAHIPALKFAYPVISKRKLGDAIQGGIAAFFTDYKFTAYTWAELTKNAPPAPVGDNRAAFDDPAATRYQLLVPAYTVTFAFFLVLTVGWLFVAERRHGTLVRLRLAPLTRSQILLGKVVPCLVVSLVQGFFLLGAGRVVFGMSWGPRPELLIPVVIGTSLAATGLAVLVASVARSETQVAVYGTLLVLGLAVVSGSLTSREMMPERMRPVSFATPHAWALDAYEKLLNPKVTAIDPAVIWRDAGVLAAFGTATLALAWWRMRLD